MDLTFVVETNKKYVAINTAIFQLKDGGTITLDREETYYSSLKNGFLTMEWHDVYLWEINGINIFDEPYQPADIYFIALIEDCEFVEFVLEDDADSDYCVEVKNFYFSN